MTPASPQNSKQAKGGTRPWVLERMVQRAQPHVNETGSRPLSPGLIFAGIAGLMLIACAVLFIFMSNTFLADSAANPPTPARILVATTPTGAPAPGTPMSQPGGSETRPAPSTPTPLATTVAPSPTPAGAPTRIKYKVQAGDTLSTIAEKYGVTVQAIMKANNMKTDVIRIGDELIIPPPTR